ncbi:MULTISPECIES: hypothetical protein [Bradyrhizobium]|uniref:hypothetical protein n=1 Tax=Bradyrhizobium TaxID=374 RepID=UPI000A991326|nr:MULTISPECIES: hypothetical protein [Bradyrhizobium]
MSGNITPPGNSHRALNCKPRAGSGASAFFGLPTWTHSIGGAAQPLHVVEPGGDND